MIGTTPVSILTMSVPLETLSIFALPNVSCRICAAILSRNSFLRVCAPKRAMNESWLNKPLLPPGSGDNKIETGV